MSKKLLDRIEELERRVRDLEARPVFVPCYPPVVIPYTPQPYSPLYPYVGDQLGTTTTVTCSAGEPGFSTSGYAMRQ